MLLGLDWAEPMMYLNLHVTCSCIRTLLFLSFDIKTIWYFSDSLSVSLSLVALWHLNVNPFHPGTLFIQGESSSSSHSDPTPSHVRFRDKKAKSDFLKNFSGQGIHSEHQVVLSGFSKTDLPIVIYNRGWESLCGISVMCPSMIIQEFYSNMHGFDYSIPQFITRVRGIHMVVTPDIISKVLHVPKVAHPDYLDCGHLKIMSKDELTSLFCETASSWGERQNTFCLAFTKGPRFLNMVMTFILHTLSHYNTIIEPRARFLLSLIEDLSIEFPFHFILSLIDVYKDMATHDKLIFLSIIMWLLCYFSVSYLEAPHFTFMYATDVATVQWSAA